MRNNSTHDRDRGAHQTGKGHSSDHPRLSRWHRRWMIPAILLGAALGLAACGGTTGSPSTSAPAGAGSTTSSNVGNGGGSKPTWVLGSIADLTGRGSNGGSAQQAGLNYYVAQVNKAGGIDGHQLRIRYCDTKSTPSGGATCASQLSSVNSHVVLLSGALPSTKGAVPHLQGVLSPSVLPVLFPKSGTKVFQVQPLEKVYVAPMLSAMKAAHLSTIGVLYTSDASGTAQLKSVKQGAAAAGIKVVSKPMEPSATDVTTQLVQLKSAGAQVLFLASIGGATLRSLTSYHSLGSNIPVVVGAQADTNSFLHALPFPVPSKLYGLSTLGVGKTGLTPAEQSAWAKYRMAFQAFAHQPPDEETTSAYRSICVVAAALKATHGGSAAAMAKYLANNRVTCLGDTIQFNVPGLNVATGIPGALTQAGPTVADGWGSVRNPL